MVGGDSGHLPSAPFPPSGLCLFSATPGYGRFCSERSQQYVMDSRAVPLVPELLRAHSRPALASHAVLASGGHMDMRSWRGCPAERRSVWSALLPREAVHAPRPLSLPSRDPPAHMSLLPVYAATTLISLPCSTCTCLNERVPLQRCHLGRLSKLRGALAVSGQACSSPGKGLVELVWKVLEGPTPGPVLPDSARVHVNVSPGPRQPAGS